MNYAGAAATASRLLTGAGQTVTHRRAIAGEYDPATGSAVESFQDTDRVGAVFPLGAGVLKVRGIDVLTGDQQLLLDGSDPQAAPGDQVQIGSDWYQVVSAAALSPAGTVVYQDLLIRGVAE